MTELLTPSQVAETLQVHPKTVGLMLASGRLPGVRVGRLWRVLPADLEAWLAGQRGNPPETPAHAA